jgi:DNA-binding MarR family transcriptional regulator
MNFFLKLNKKVQFMGAIKPNDYSQNDINLSLIARAMAHPARIRIIRILREEKYYRNIDFSTRLNLSTVAVKDHIDKLKDAGLVGIHYLPHHYIIFLHNNKLHHLSGFIVE